MAKTISLDLLAIFMYKTTFLIAFLFASVVFFAHFWVVGSAVWGDGRYYYSYVRSLVLNKDLDFKNELEYFDEPVRITKTGMVANKFSLGPAIFWLPGFLLTHLFAKGDGYGHLYQVLVGLTAVFWGILGLYFCFLLTKRYFSEKTALLSCLAIWLGSNLFFYTAVDPLNSHAVSFFAASLFLYFWELGKLGRLGFLGGILGMIRLQDLIFVLPAGGFLLKKRIKIINFIMGIIIGFLPQVLVWKIIYGEITSPYLLEGGRFNWLGPKIFSVLFSRQNGLFYYSPILILGMLGLLRGIKEYW